MFLNFVPAAVLLLTVLSTSALAITRTTVHDRMQDWINRKIPYSQSNTTDGYRQDCSGFVSMGWQSSQPGHTTSNMLDICTKIDKTALAMGDAILKSGSHVIMFDKWVSSDAFMAYQEQQTGTVAMYYQSSWSKVTGEGYFGCRYNNIQ